MDIETQRYMHTPPPLYVDAVRVTAENMEAVAAWCDGKIEELDEKDVPPKFSKEYIQVRVINPRSFRQTQAFVGDWVLKGSSGFKVYSNGAFGRAFTQVEPVLFADPETK